MSNGNNPLIGNGGGNGGNPLVPSAAQLAPANPFAQAAAPPNPMDHRNVSRAHVSLALHGLDQDALIRKRDDAGKEMAKLAEVMNNPNPNRAEIVDYIHDLTQNGQVTPQEATAIMHSLPQNRDDIHQWAKMMFATLMHVGIHGHAAYPQELFPGPQAAPQQAAPEPEGTPPTPDTTAPPDQEQPP